MLTDGVNVGTLTCICYAVIIIAIRLRYDYDSTTIRLRRIASILRDSTRAKNEHVIFFVVVVL